MAIYDDVVKGLWVDGSSGSCGARRATAAVDLAKIHMRHHRVIVPLWLTGDPLDSHGGHPQGCVERPGGRANGSPGPKAPMETIPMHNPGQAKQSQDRQKPGKNQAGVSHPSSVQIHPSPIVESQTTHPTVNPYRPCANPPLSYIGIPDDSPQWHVTDRNERCLVCWIWIGTIRIPNDPPPATE